MLGGLDINILTRSTPAEVRREIGKLMDECGPRGRYAVGSGNSVPSYIPVENYLAMVEEAVSRRGLELSGTGARMDVKIVDSRETSCLPVLSVRCSSKAPV